MPSKSLAKNSSAIKELEKKISPVLVVNNSTLKPYVELFDYAPENIYQQPLGSLVGFFEIKDYSEESAYIVNFLTSVLKKEYYINPKRPVTESLDSALHKVNLALSELAKHGNVDWLGKLHAAICVLEKNNAHFSVAGSAKIFLYRKNNLTEISEDLASDVLEPHPLKTFINVSSGRLEKNDRMLITAEDIFHILSQNDLKKNFQRFEGEKFVQFLKTALSNQMEMIASIVVGLEESEPVIKNKKLAPIKVPKTDNVFSQTSFNGNPEKDLEIENAVALAEEFASENPESENAYTDEKTGHIYIQGETGQAPEISKTQIFLEATKEKISEGWYLTKNATRRQTNIFKKNLAKKLEARRIEKEKLAQFRAQQEKAQEEERILHEIELEQQLAQQAQAAKILAQEAAEKEATKVVSRHIPVEIEEPQAAAPQKEISKPIQKELSFEEKLRLAIKDQQKNVSLDLRSKTKVAPKEESLQEEDSHLSEESFEEEFEQTNEGPVSISLASEESQLLQVARKFQTNGKKITKKIALQSQQAFETSKNFLVEKYHDWQETRGQKSAASIQENHPHLAPRFSEIKKSFAFFTSKQKTYTIIALILIFVVPIFIAKWINRPKPHQISELQNIAPEPKAVLANEKNMAAETKEQVVYSQSGLIATLLTNVGPVAITKTSVKISTSGDLKDYPLPAGDGNALRATYMNDLALVLILTDQNKIVSFSPTSLKFAENNISLPEDSKNVYLGTYLTYLYVIDPAANQIYRYPRADGGFGEKTSWLKTGNKVSDISDTTIDENIWTIQNNQVFKFFKGQSQAFSLESSQTPVHFDQIYTNLDAKSLWVLDKQNGRLIEYSKTDGTIIKQYALDELKNATSLVVDEKNKTAYVTTPSGLNALSLQ